MLYNNHLALNKRRSEQTDADTGLAPGFTYHDQIKQDSSLWDVRKSDLHSALGGKEVRALVGVLLVGLEF